MVTGPNACPHHLSPRHFRCGTLQQRMQATQQSGHCRYRRLCNTVQAAASTQLEIVADDKWIQRTLSSHTDNHRPQNETLERLHQQCIDTLKTMRMPTNRSEAYRFTDVAPIMSASFQVASGDGAEEAVGQHPLDAATSSRLVIVDGVASPELSSLCSMPDGMYIGGIQNAPSQAVSQQLGVQSAAYGNALPFAALNGALATDVACVVVPAGMHIQQPLHVLYLSTESTTSATAMSNPRLLVIMGDSSSLELVEEFAPGSGNRTKYFTNSVTEVQLDEGAQLNHGYAEVQSGASYHMKASMVRQAARSSYTCNEAAMGAAISRHDLSIQQVGEATSTSLRAFTVCGEGQLHDLHSKLHLNHPEGQANQLHKCIVSAASGRGVFDGNVRVGQAAQKTDAQQLSRNLLLVPRATVNVKPNLQIIADDVKCSHGCAVSDLEEDQMFYFRARGIDADAARQVLVYSFGAEVTQHLKHKQLIQRVQKVVATTLAKAPLLPVESR